MRILILILQLALFQQKRLLIEVSNNGARSPITKDDFTAQPWDKQHLQGEITDVGLRSHYLLGRYFRNTTVDTELLPEYYNPTSFVIKSAPYSSAEMSAFAQALGLYTPGLGPSLEEI